MEALRTSNGSRVPQKRNDAIQLRGALRLPRSYGDADLGHAIAEHRIRGGVAAHSVRELWKWNLMLGTCISRRLFAAVIRVTVAGDKTHLVFMFMAVWLGSFARNVSNA